MSEETLTAHSSAMWQGANFKDADLSSFRIPFSFGSSSAVLAERERCAKIAEEPDSFKRENCSQIEFVAFMRGYDTARRIKAQKIREGA